VALDWHVTGLPSCTSLNRIGRKRLSAALQACLSFALTAAVITRIFACYKHFHCNIPFCVAFTAILSFNLSRHTSLRRKPEGLLRYSHIPCHYFLPPALQVFTALTLVQPQRPTPVSTCTDGHRHERTEASFYPYTSKKYIASIIAMGEMTGS